jgi:4-hydroxybenzoate-CoA ligase
MDANQMTGNAVAWFVRRPTDEGRGEHVAFVDPRRRLTYGGLDTESARFAQALRTAGIQREQRIALLMLDTVDFPVVFWGALRAGIVPVPINTLLPPDLVRYILADSRAAVLVASAPLLAGLRLALRELPELRRIIVAAPDGSPPPVEEPHEVPLPRVLANASAVDSISSISAGPSIRTPGSSAARP